jgi:phage/plasmid-associated DNA primase
MEDYVNINKLKNFLEKVRVGKGAPFTHITTESPTMIEGKYYIPKEAEYHAFDLICDAVYSGEPGLTLAEKPGIYTPLRVDFDFTCSVDVGINRQYTLNIVKRLVKYYQEEIKNVINPVNFEENMLICIVLEKKCPRLEKSKSGNPHVKDGMHFHFPFFVCDKMIQDRYIRDKVISRMIKDDIWKDCDFITPIEDIIDKNIATKQWMMYGAMNYKSEHSTPYIYNRWKNPLMKKIKSNSKKHKKNDEEWGYAFDYNLNNISMDDIFDDVMVGRENDLCYYLPIFMTIRGFVEHTPLKIEIEQKVNTCKVLAKKTRKTVSSCKSDDDIFTEFKIIKQAGFMEMLAQHRAEDYDEWMDVGFTLFNIMNGKEEGLQLWIEFSQRSIRYVEGECEDLWNRMEVRNKTIGSLKSMARKDSPHLYEQWRSTNTTGTMYESIRNNKPNELDISKVIIAMSDNKFKCADSKNNLWYVFRDGRYHQQDDGMAIKTMITDEVIPKYYDLRTDIQEKNQNGAEDSIKKINGVINLLGTVTFHKKVIEMSKIRMHDESFLKKVNENRMVLCCENGVLDLELCIFRDGRPDDYCTFSTGIEYREYNDDDEEVQALDLLLLKTFPNKNIRDYALTATATCLQGGNQIKKILIFTGPTSGGKSMFFRLLELTMGEYFGKFPRELFIKGVKCSSNAARPELARTPGKRIMSTQEITHMESFDIGVLKELSGNDTHYTRGNYKDGGEIDPQYTNMFQCNKPPKVPGNDDATCSRLRIVRCEAKFVLPEDLEEFPVPETFEEQLKMKIFEADLSLRESLPDLAPVFLWKLFQYFKQYKLKGLKEPPEVVLDTKSYINENDVYGDFIQNKINILKDDHPEIETSYIKLKEMHSAFKTWYTSNYPSYSKNNMIGENELKTELIRRLAAFKNDKTLHKYDRYNDKFFAFIGYKILDDEF